MSYDGKSKQELQSEGWVFSGNASADGAGNAVPASKNSGHHFFGNADVSAEEADGERLFGMVVQNGSSAAEEVLAIMAIDGRVAVQTGGCKAIAVLSEKEPGRSAVIEIGAIVAVTKAMEGLLAAPTVQASGCSALANLCIGEGANSVLEGGGIAAVLAGMEAHPAEVSVQAKGCLALGNIGFSAEGEALALKAGAIDAILEALKSLGQDAKVVEEACDALSNLAAGAAGKEALLAKAGVEVLRAAQGTHPSIASAGEVLQALGQ